MPRLIDLDSEGAEDVIFFRGPFGVLYDIDVHGKPRFSLRDRDNEMNFDALQVMSLFEVERLRSCLDKAIAYHYNKAKENG